VSHGNGAPETWAHVAGSEGATYVTSFLWENANSVYVSTFGRGLWKLRNRRIAADGPALCPDCDVVSADGGPTRPPFDHGALIFGGQVLGVRTDDRKLREVLVTPGSSVVFIGDPKDLQEDIAITESDGGKGSKLEPLPKGPDGWIATGVVFTKEDEPHRSGVLELGAEPVPAAARGDAHGLDGLADEGDAVPLPERLVVWAAGSGRAFRDRFHGRREL
jgi:hypothetical protein